MSPVVRSGPLVVQSDWIDIYGHMNASRYFDVFVQEGYSLLNKIGLGSAYTSESGCGVFVVSVAAQFFHEMKQDETFRVSLRVLEVDKVRLLVLLEMFSETQSRLTATFEQLFLNVCLSTRKTKHFSNQVRDQLDQVAKDHSGIALPPKHVRHLNGLGRNYHAQQS